MKLFKCPRCGKYQNHTRADVLLNVRVKLHSSGYWTITGEDFELPCYTDFKIEELNLLSTSCCECEEPLEMVDVERCPHQTDKSHWDYYGTTRRCRLCGEEQIGAVRYF